jgi:hypothetical protein
LAGGDGSAFELQNKQAAPLQGSLFLFQYQNNLLSRRIGFQPHHA